MIENGMIAINDYEYNNHFLEHYHYISLLEFIFGCIENVMLDIVCIWFLPKTIADAL